MTGEWQKILICRVIMAYVKGVPREANFAFGLTQRKEWQQRESLYLVWLFPWSSCWGTQGGSCPYFLSLGRVESLLCPRLELGRRNRVGRAGGKSQSEEDRERSKGAAGSHLLQTGQCRDPSQSSHLWGTGAWGHSRGKYNRCQNGCPWSHLHTANSVHLYPASPQAYTGALNSLNSSTLLRRCPDDFTQLENNIKKSGCHETFELELTDLSSWDPSNVWSESLTFIGSNSSRYIQFCSSHCPYHINNSLSLICDF